MLPIRPTNDGTLIRGIYVGDLSKQALNIDDLRRMAKRRLTKALFDFCDKGSEDQIAMRDNRTALDRIKLMPVWPLLTKKRARPPATNDEFLVWMFGRIGNKYVEHVLFRIRRPGQINIVY